ncbi:MAG: MFS transporter [Eubacteriales bacterium]|jgi:fucose permease|nr:MFS transporter [Eubacteriales bacterium]
MPTKKLTFKPTLYACYLGTITLAIVINLAPILFIVFQEAYGITYEMLGRLVLVNFVTQIVTDILAIRYADRIGYRISIVAAHILAFTGLCALGILPVLMGSSLSYTAITIATVIYAIGGGLLEVLVSPIVEALPGDAKASTMALLHGFYCWGQVAVVLLSTLLLHFIGYSNWFIIPILWSLIPLFNSVLFTRVPIVPIVPDGKSISPGSLLKSKLFIPALILMVCSGASEQVMAQWSSLFAEKGLGVSKIIGDLLGPCLFAVFMGTGRTLYGLFGHKINLRKTLIYCSFLCVICYLTASFAPNSFIALAGCAVCGLSVSLMWPGMLSLTAEQNPGGGIPMFGMLAVAGDVGCAVGPWLTGAVSSYFIGTSTTAAAQQPGLKAGLLSAIVFPVIMIIGIFRLHKKTRV